MLRLLVLISIVGSYAHAQHTKKRPPVKNRSGINIQYEQRAWNLDSKAINTGYVVIKDSESNRTVIVHLQETEPDSSIFAGKYSITLGTMTNYTPSIFVPKPEHLLTDSGKKLFLEEIKAESVPRKPFVLRRQDKEQVLEIFDTRRQAQLAVRNYRRQKALSKSEEVLKEQQLVETTPLETASSLAIQKKLSELKKQAQFNHKQRQKDLEATLARLKELRVLYDSKSKSEQQNLTMDSSADLQAALELYASRDFTAAAPALWSAIEKDPYNNAAIYSYAVNLFKQEDFSKSIIFFYLVEDKGIDVAEKDYYLAINHYRLIEFVFAVPLFEKVKRSSNKALSSSSAYYLGLINFQSENYSVAKGEFEFVLDHSIDPELDKQAEAYIERILQEMQFQKSRAKPFYANLSMGLQQDSNILLQPDGTGATAVATNEAGIRAQLTASLEYKAIYTRETEWGLKAHLLYFYSLDDEFTQADPLDIIISAPYKKNSTLWGKNYRMELEPGLESLYMDLNREGSKHNILNAGFLNWKNTFIMSEKWISNYNFQVYLGDSDIDISSPEEDASSTRFTFNYNNIYFLNREKGKTLVYDLSVSLNDAKGENYTYQRFDFAISYIQPIIFWDLTLSAKIAYYMANYDSIDNRKDKNTSFQFAATKMFNDWLGANAQVGFVDNSSTLATRDYDKYTIGTNILGKWNF